MMTHQIKEKARHVYYCGEGSVPNELVDKVLYELNENLGGYWGAGVSNEEITWIEKVGE